MFAFVCLSLSAVKGNSHKNFQDVILRELGFRQINGIFVKIFEITLLLSKTWWKCGLRGHSSHFCLVKLWSSLNWLMLLFGQQISQNHCLLTVWMQQYEETTCLLCVFVVFIKWHVLCPLLDSPLHFFSLDKLYMYGWHFQSMCLCRNVPNTHVFVVVSSAAC